MQSKITYQNDYFFKKFKIYSNIEIKFSNNLIETQDELELGLLEEVKLQTDRVKIPLIVYYGIENITALDFDYLTIPDSIINQNNINFYLVEPLTTYSTHASIKNWYCEYYPKDNEFIKAKELDSIDNFCRRYNLKNVTVYSSEFNIKSIFSKKYSNLNLETRSLVYPFSCKHLNDTSVNSKIIKKKFWCGNNRYTTHRHIIASYLVSTVPRKELNISWIRESKIDYLDKNLIDLDYFGERKKLIVNGVNILDNISPISFDLALPTKLKVDEKFQINFKLQNPVESYKESFCVIINETRFFQSTTVISEKIINAILNKKFFILVAPPHTLAYLKIFGFKTFDNWIDESYDNETCHNTRLNKIFNLIDYINSKNINDLIVMQKKMTSILLHNYNIAKEGIRSKQFLQTLEETISRDS